MDRENRFAARIAFRLPQSLYGKLEGWAEEEDCPLANLIYSLIKKAVTERENQFKNAAVQQSMSLENAK